MGDNSEGTAATAGDRGTADSGGGGPAALSVAANAGEGDAGGGGLVGTDYPVTGWMVVAGALLLGLAVLLLVRYGWAAVRRGGGAATG